MSTLELCSTFFQPIDFIASTASLWFDRAIVPEECHPELARQGETRSAMVIYLAKAVQLVGQGIQSITLSTVDMRDLYTPGLLLMWIFPFDIWAPPTSSWHKIAGYITDLAKPGPILLSLSPPPNHQSSKANILTIVYPIILKIWILGPSVENLNVEQIS